MRLKWIVVLLLISTVNPLWCVEGKILICGVCKNVEKRLCNTITSVEAIGVYFDDYQVLIYENNSTDRIKEMLAEWAANNPCVHIESENLSMEALKKFLLLEHGTYFPAGWNSSLMLEIKYYSKPNLPNMTDISIS